MATLMRNVQYLPEYLAAIREFRESDPNGSALSTPEDLAVSIHEAFKDYMNVIEGSHHMDIGVLLRGFYATNCKMRLAYNAQGVQGGYIVLNGELIGLFATKGKGSWLLNHAMNDGAVLLDCFDGFLPKFYAKHGWTEFQREANWTAGEPDVVFMSRTAN